MYLQFVGSLVILSFVFRWLVGGIATLISIVFSFFFRRFSLNTDNISYFNQVISSVLYSGLLALTSLYYSQQPDVEYHWLYPLTSFVLCYSLLTSGAHEKRKLAMDPTFAIDVDTRKVIAGAELGALLGLLLFFVFYNWPSLLLFIPGAASVLKWVFSIADWLMEFILVRIIAGLAAVWYIFAIGFTTLFTGFVLLISASSSIINKLKRAA